MANEQIALSFKQGITNVPGDATCDDNALEECVGMVFADGEHRVIQKPVEYITGLASTQTLLYVHKLNYKERYIIKDVNAIKWGTKSDANVYQPAQEEVLVLDVQTIRDIVLFYAYGDVQVTSIGNILIISDVNGQHFFFWKDNGYEEIENFVAPDVKFMMSGAVEHQSSQSCTFLETTTVSTSSGNRIRVHIVNGEQETYNNAVIGLYSKNLKAIKDGKMFAEPFFACSAIEMYDGSYIMQTSPQLLFPAVRTNTAAVFGSALTLSTYASFLLFKASYDYTKLKDIIKDVVIFVTDGTNLYDTEVDQRPRDCFETDGTFKTYWDSVRGDSTTVKSIYEHEEFTSPTAAYFLPLKAYTDTQIRNNIKGNGIFYKLASLGIQRNDNAFKYAQAIIEPHIVQNLTSQQRLPLDFYSRCSLGAAVVKAYNNRLHLAEIERGFTDIDTYLIPYEDAGASAVTKTVKVNISTPSGWVYVGKTFVTKQKTDYYFYYPDPRARQVIIDGVKYELEEHPTLNGAFMLNALPTALGTSPSSTSTESIDSVRATTEYIPSQIYVSEVNNPFTFPPANVVQLQAGKILAMASLTQALSQGQFGQFPLVAFADNGLWSLQVGGTGVYTAAHPMSREVMIDGMTPIETDRAVFFSSKKGLMVVTGSDVRCVSEQLNGMSTEPFANFLKNAFIAYDYRDSLLWIFDGHKEGGVIVGSRFCYVYSIKSGTFGRFDFGAQVVTTTVNNYPDYLLQAGQKVYSLLCRPNINEDYASGTYPRQYTATMKTRPMKLENALALKSIMQIRHILQFTPYTATETSEDPETHETVTTDITQKGSMTLQIFASNNLDHWAELHSLRGTPWKYYKFVFNFSNLIATDRFAGTVLVTQERRTNKLR